MAKRDYQAEAQARDEAVQIKGEAQAKNEAAQGNWEPKTMSGLVRHKTKYPKYRCAGLVLTQKPETYQVTEAQWERLRRDPWVEQESLRK